MGNIALGEQETVINIERESDVASIWTSDSTMITKLDKLVKDNNDWQVVEVSTVDGEVVAKKYSTKKSLVSFRSKKTSKTLTDEQKQAAADRLRKARMSKSKA